MVSIFLLTDVPVAFDSTDHTHRCVFHASEPCGQGSAKASLICTSEQLVGRVIKIKEPRFPFM